MSDFSVDPRRCLVHGMTRVQRFPPGRDGYGQTGNVSWWECPKCLAPPAAIDISPSRAGGDAPEPDGAPIVFRNLSAAEAIAELDANAPALREALAALEAAKRVHPDTWRKLVLAANRADYNAANALNVAELDARWTEAILDGERLRATVASLTAERGRDMALLRLLEVTAYNLSMATLVGNPAPRVKRLYDRMSAPQVGDLVLEYSTIYREERVGTRLGRLVRIAEEPIAAGDDWPADDPIPTERVWYIALPDGREFRWINASFLAVPTAIDRHDVPFVSDGYTLRATPPTEGAP